VVSTDERLIDDVLRLVAAAGAEAELAHGGPALRRAHREAALVLVGADALAAGAVRALPRRPGVVVVTAGELPPAEWARAVELGAERVAELPADDGWLVGRVGSAVRTPVERGWLVAVGGSSGGAGSSTVAAALAVAAAPDVLLVDVDAWGAGLDLLLGGERVEGLRWPELAALRGRVAGAALLASLPDIGGVTVLAASRSSPVVVPEEAVTSVAEAARSAGHAVVADLSRADGTERAIVSDADLALLVVPARLRAATAARLLVDAPGSPWAAARLVVRAVPGGLSRAEVEEVVGRPVLADLPHDRSAMARAERGEPPSVAARAPLGRMAVQILGQLRSAAVAS
jgi:secretion/DNA translocation related CpaE-like protein